MATVAVQTFRQSERETQASASRVALVSPDNSNDLQFATRAISFAGAGDIKVTTVGGDTVVIPSGALVAGIMHALEVTRIWATGTTATGIVAYW